MASEVPFRGRVVINISGVIYETHLATLARFPQTLLGCSEKRKQYYDCNTNQYFFNRNRKGFEAILYYYQSKGRLSKPPDVPFDVFRDEVEFFQLGNEVLDDLFRKEGYVVESPRRMPGNKFQRRVWQSLEYPDTSRLANILTLISLTIIVISVLQTIIMTVHNDQEFIISNVTSNGHQSTNESWHGEKSIWFTVEVILNTLFGIEYVLRLAFSPDKFSFVRSP